ncbi:MAG: cellulose biosynthesis cyclic di-GMP-binding regulatory protein BcsB [Pseudacidovorax sp.]|nr:cellulose biosynthesis cyclic di-GMP-binding regulatory protein BcsB [Pseudacidovorax sp.]
MNGMRAAPHAPRRSPACGRRLLPAALALGLLAGPAPGLHAQQPAPTGAAAATVPAPGTAVAGPPVREATLRQLGVDYAIQLRGTSGAVGIPFSVRADELVTGGSLRLNYTFSPALIPALSHLKVSVNDVVLATLPVDPAAAGRPQTAEIAIDRRLVTEFNRLVVELVGHYTRDCEDPNHSSLWAAIDSGSTLRLSVQPLTLDNDLRLLPVPFFDRRDVGRLTLPFVLPAGAAPEVLEAAGIVASWFGALAGYRGARFPVSEDTLPTDGHAVVFATPQALPAGVAMPPIDGPQLAVAPMPGHAQRKLLLVMGRDATELRSAASALALGSPALAGAQARIAGFEPPPARKPYDAPRWVPSDRPVQLGELAQAQDLNVSGYAPDVIRVNLQLPPDLFTWRSHGMPLALHYRYTPRVRPDQSTLNINMGQSFIGAVPLRAANTLHDAWWNPFALPLLPDGTVAEKKTVQVPPQLLAPSSQLRLHYYFEPSAGKCQPLLANVRGAIDPDSTLDLSGLPHYIAMPDLAAYANAGFPFSRLADLADSAVLLPPAPTAQDLGLYLGLMGQIGRSTGYPALRLRVGDVRRPAEVADKDLLVLGDLDRQPLFGEWRARMPLSQPAADTQRLELPGWLRRALDIVAGSRMRQDLPQAAQLDLRGAGRETAVLAGFESPLRPGRSVIAVVAEPGQGDKLLDALQTPELLQRVQGSMAVVREGRVESVLGGQPYYVGRLPPLTWLQWQLSRNAFMPALLALAAAALAAAVAYAGLQRRARRRLE